ncbi:1-acyl-sn-glycerol-3-phosphate acyltransferase [Leeuwenhoekiella nanhaiensis]|uniref:Acyltransferase n=1 Tax=Leeuwenhoekiella nanhaiensis TaxID=1655491 RepID=A0A2G1VUA9_9FLAO|nr:1-acyl-sn-glycerol-3-phosphate acyltransferase [Leeuwenhoekiella nanhaiensis]PHQ30373.1 acyltransferase [Leeuwenhoekiella nanhaiensis]
MKFIAKTIYRLLGWKIVGRFPKEVQKMVVIAAPHTSWHDFYMGLLFRSIIDVKVNFLGKKELFRPPFGWYFKKVGGTPLDRTPGQNKVTYIASLFKERETFRLALSPEGTRKKVTEWKTGFYFIALEAGVPILPVTMDFGQKQHHIGDLFYPTGNLEADLKTLRQFFDGVVGKVPENS